MFLKPSEEPLPQELNPFSNKSQYIIMFRELSETWQSRIPETKSRNPKKDKTPHQDNHQLLSNHKMASSLLEMLRSESKNCKLSNIA